MTHEPQARILKKGPFSLEPASRAGSPCSRHRAAPASQRRGSRVCTQRRPSPGLGAGASVSLPGNGKASAFGTLAVRQPSVQHPRQWALAGDPEMGQWGEGAVSGTFQLDKCQLHHTRRVSPGRSQPQDTGGGRVPSFPGPLGVGAFPACGCPPGALHVHVRAHVCPVCSCACACVCPCVCAYMQHGGESGEGPFFELCGGPQAACGWPCVEMQTPGTLDPTSVQALRP